MIEMDEHELKFQQMTQPPVPKLICKLAIPCIISMLVTSFYNMADTFFVGMLHSNAATGFYSALVAGILICVLGQIFLEPLAYLLGSTDTMLRYTKDYLRVILLGAPWMTTSLVLNNQLRYQGNAM